MRAQGKKSTIWTRGFCCILISNICANMSMFAVNTYITTYMSFLGVGAALAGVVAGLFYATGLLMRPVSGPMQAALNKKKLMTATYLLSVVVNFAYAFCPNVALFVAFRLLHGVQLAFFGSLALTIASDSLPEERMNSGIGIFGLSGIVAQALGPSLSTFVKGLGEAAGGPQGGFRAIFLSAAFFSLLSVIPCFFLPDEGENREKKAAGAWYKNIIALPALMPSAIIGLFTLASILYTTYIIPYGEYKGIPNAGIFFTVNAVIMVITRPFLGRFTDKYGQNRAFYPGILLYMASFVVIATARNTFMLGLSAALAAVGAGLVSPAAQAMALQSVKNERRPVASNTVYTLMDVGNFLGPTLGGMMLASGNYERMFLSALLPLGLSAVIFALGWKSYVRNRAASQQ